MMEILVKYDTQIEVTQQQYKNLVHSCSGFIATRIENGKYYIKVLVMKHLDYISEVAGVNFVEKTSVKK